MTEALALEDALMLLAQPDRDAVLQLDAAATGLGYAPIVSAGGAKPGSFRVEYKGGKPSRSLFILRVDGAKWGLKPKLIHLAEYIPLLDGLTEPTRARLLKSPKCKEDGMCKGPVRFAFDGADRSLCRYSMQVTHVTAQDIPGLIALLEAEASEIKKEGK